MTFFSPHDKARIAKAITLAEAKTSAEIIAIVTRKSDDYRFIALLWAALIALAIPFILIFFPQMTGWSFSFQPPENIYFIQIFSFVALAIFFQWEPVRIFCTPSFIQKKRAHNYAMEQFISQGLYQTSQRRGVLIFVSVLERYIEVIADKEVFEKVDGTVWQEVITLMTQEIDKDQPGEAFIKAITLCGDILSQTFPPDTHNKNELPNHLIEL